MKKIILLSVTFILLSNLAFSQYKINKTKYDYHTYTYQIGDPYNPSVAGVASFLLPGLGQMLSGEGDRGVAFLLGDIGFAVICVVGYENALNYIETKSGATGIGAMVIGLMGTIVIDIWSIVDAVHVAKVNNLAFRDKNKSSLNFKIQPYFGNMASTRSSNIPMGLSLKMTF